MPAPFDLPYVQAAVLEILLLAAAAGVLGTWIVLRGLSFYAHAVGTAAFPGLVLADGLGFSASLGAFATAGIVAVAVTALSRRRADAYDTTTAMVLVGALALGIVLASDVFRSPGSVDRLLFGSLLVVDAADQRFAGAMAAAVLVATAVLGRRWLAAGFDPRASRAMGARSWLPDAVLLLLVALAAIAALDAIGALLAAALLVVPAATTRLTCSRMATWQAATVALAAAEGVAGVWLAVETNAPPGAATAVLGSGVFAIVAIVRGLRARRSSRRPVALACVLLAGAVAAGCASSGGDDAGGRIPVVVTTTQLGDIVREAGGDEVSVTQILRPNTDPHDYEPRPDDVAAAARAAVVVVSGDDLDAWISDVLDAAGVGRQRVLDAGAGRPVRLAGERSGDQPSRLDPHWWHDPLNVVFAVRRIRAALVAARPEAAAALRRSARAYERRVRRLDAGIRACFARVPRARRRLVTDHDAFGYFARRYGIRVVGAVIPSQSTRAQPSAGDLSDLAATIRRQRVRAVFPESSLSPRLARAIARETGASARLTLYGDTLGPKGSAGGTYLGMERANADAMARGFTAGRRGCAIGGLG